ncbi:hypothetical protein RM844_06225 [Streptomyces sp. DSM 44915]|uniref:DUF8017 domain-containing protein n=1 Tax=Streptomyces chisholmiae TaxID=3075540 RepID=A0ABU2JLN1_9ACTN|nr:hypothetical protein [Streptomyces sp. DSM 44915]MDT0265885.1 hypothetical protein [Streptomyces sp. DSM 44915]
MRPGEEQPGGEPAREWSNPYQQPGYQQPNPYQQPTPGAGWGAPGAQGGPGAPAGQPGAPDQPGAPTGQPGMPAGQPGVPPAPPPGQQGMPPTPPPGAPGGWQQQGPPTLPPQSPPPQDDKKSLKVMVGIIVSVAVVAGAAVTGVVLMSGDDDTTTDANNQEASADPGEAGDPDEEPTEESTEEPERPSNPNDPRRGVTQRPDPVIAPDWQVQTLENRHIAFDVPAEDWTVNPESTSMGLLDEREGAEEGDILVAMSGVATYLDGWCPEAEHGVSSRAMVGTKGAQGATNTAEAAENEAMNWALGGWDQQQLGTFEMTEPEEFESDYGISGHIVRATIRDVPPDEEDPNPCGQSDGKVIAISYLDLNNDMATWVMMADAGIPEELDDATIEQIMSSMRPYPVESEQS